MVRNRNMLFISCFSLDSRVVHMLTFYLFFLNFGLEGGQVVDVLFVFSTI